MRPPSDMPPRQPRRRRERRGRRLPTGRGRVALIVIVVALFILATSLRGIAGFYTDYLWFDSLGLASIWRGVLGAKTALALIFIGFFFILLWTNLFIADRIAPTFRLPASGPEDDLVERYHEIVGHRAGTLRTGVSLLLALIVGAGVSAKWKDWILFTNRVDFGRKDATFHTDIGFYVFQLPFLRFVLGWLFSALIVVLIATIVAHYLNGGIRIQVPGQRVSPQVKAHLSVLLGVLSLVRAGQYWLDRYQLVFSTRGTVEGATYTDVNVQVKSLYLLMIISITAFVLFLVNIRRRGWVLPGIAVGLWLFVIVLAGEAVPALVQRFRVKPDEPSKEAVYIGHNIAATRYSMGLDGVSSKRFVIDGKLDRAALDANSDIINNVRLWDPAVVQAAFDRAQGSGLRDFYSIPDVDVDRYTLANRTNDPDSNVTQVNVAARQLARDGIPQKSWVSEHLTYTHGYGAVVSPANVASDGGQPRYTLQDVPLAGTPKITQPRVYIGEGQTGYVIVNSGVKELDYTDDAGNNVQRNYSGKDGVKLNSFMRRAAFALRFGDINPLISSNVTSNSKLLLQRNVRDRVEAAAPFLQFDADPYPVIENGRIVWVIDGYTTTSNYPNAQRADTTDVSDQSGLADNFNYVRNSVKATVDAYDGTITMYVVDESDPIIRAYEKAFPELFTPGSQVPADLRSHFRYPEDLFRVQTQMWGRYHVTDASSFYSGNNQWDVAPDPEITDTEVQGPTTTIAGEQIRQSPRVDPYYLLMRLPQDKHTAFTLFRSFVARSEGNRTRALTAFMAVKSDPDNYGQIESFAMPSSQLPLGPQDVVQAIKADKDVSSEITLLCQQASRCLSTNLLILPIDNSLLYIRPLYVAAESENSAPRLEKVIIAFQPRGTGALKVQIGDDLQGALDGLFPAGTGPTTPPSNNNGNGNNGNGNNGNKGSTSLTAQEQQLVDEIDAAYKAADAAYANGDLEEGGRQLAIARSRYQDLRDLLDAGATTGGSKEGGGSTTTTSTTQPSSSSTTSTTTPTSTTAGGG